MTRFGTAFALIIGAATACMTESRQKSVREERLAMVEQQIRARGVSDPRVLDAMRKVPRERFVPSEQEARAYDDSPLPIGQGQTISQPYIVAYMSEALEVSASQTVLEIGTGSGYQAAILSPLAGQVYSIEIVPELGATAKSALERLGYSNIEIRVADGYYGWSEAAPFDGIVVTAAASHIPPPLIEQLKTGGRMVIPIGGVFATQQLMLVVKLPDGGVTTRQLLPVTFVPFTRADGK